MGLYLSAVYVVLRAKPETTAGKGTNLLHPRSTGTADFYHSVNYVFSFEKDTTAA